MRKLIVYCFVVVTIIVTVICISCSENVTDAVAVGVGSDSIVGTESFIDTAVNTHSVCQVVESDIAEIGEPVVSEQTETYSSNSEEVIALAKLLWGECRGVASKMNQAAVVWCVLNRVDSDLCYMPDNIIAVVTQQNQFIGYRESNPVSSDLVNLVIDVLNRWEAEKNGSANVGRVLPKKYIYFYGDGIENHFRDEYSFSASEEWNWDCVNPYEVK